MGISAMYIRNEKATPPIKRLVLCSCASNSALCCLVRSLVSSLGEARSILKAESRDLRNVPEVASWKLKIFDKDKTISVSELEKDIPQVMRFWSDEGIRVEHLGEAFQIYGRVMPETGPAFRIEPQSKVENSENVDLADAIIRETFPEIKFKSAFDMLHDLNKRVERMEGKREQR
jgi:hypothetical protein